MEGLLNNREIAVAVWLAIFIAFAAYWKVVRSGAWDVVKAFFTPKLFIPMALSFLPSAIVIAVLAHFGLWDLSALKETIYWIIGTGFVMFAGFTKVNDAKGLLKKTAKDTLKLVILLEFFIGFYVFPLWVELLLVPFTTLVILLSTVAEYQKGEDYDLVKKFLSGLTSIIGLLVILFATIAFINNPKPLFSYQNLELFLLPIALSFVYFPSVYLLALYSKYELVFLRIDMFLGHFKGTWRIKLACIKRCGFSVYLTGEIIRHLAINFTNETTKAEALELVRDFDPTKRSFL